MTEFRGLQIVATVLILRVSARGFPEELGLESVGCLRKPITPLGRESGENKALSLQEPGLLLSLGLRDPSFLDFGPWDLNQWPRKFSDLKL